MHTGGQRSFVQLRKLAITPEPLFSYADRMCVFIWSKLRNTGVYGVVVLAPIRWCLQIRGVPTPTRGKEKIEKYEGMKIMENAEKKPSEK